MSLDVYLKRKRWTSYDKGISYIEDDETLYNANITHNLGRMATAARLYDVLWHPENIGKIGELKACGIIKLIEKGLANLKARPRYFEKFNSPNGWGMYEHFVPFVEKYLDACKKFPEAKVYVDI